MLNKIEQLTELLSWIEGTDLDPEHEQRMRDLKMHWTQADTNFHAGFYRLKRYGADDAPTVSPAIEDLKESFQMLEKCCREWREELGRFLPES